MGRKHLIGELAQILVPANEHDCRSKNDDMGIDLVKLGGESALLGRAVILEDILHSLVMLSAGDAIHAPEAVRGVENRKIGDHGLDDGEGDQLNAARPDDSTGIRLVTAL
jgi:hypothetical protein